MPQQGHERHETHAKRFTRGGKPTLTFNPANNLVYINAAGLRQLWEMEYALFIISSVEKRLSIFLAMPTNVMLCAYAQMV